MSGKPAHIRLIRNQSKWKDRARRYKVVIDDQVIGKIKNGEEKTFDVSPGTHRIFLKIDWARSPTIECDVGADQQVEFVASAGTISTSWRAFFRPGQYLELVRIK